MGGTFFAISQNKSGQNLVSNSTQNSAQSSFISQSSSSLFSSISSSQSSQSQKAFSSQQTISNSNSISQSSLINSQGSTSLKKDSISVEDRKFWYQKLKWSEMCEDRFSWRSDENESGVKFLNLSDTEFLVEISCGYGPYQRWSNFVYYDEKNDISKLLEFDSYDEKSNKIKIDILTSAGFDSKTKTFRTWNKYVGHGGCGYIGDYKWDNDLKSFELTEFRQYTDCEKPIGDSNWKVIYQK